MGRGLNHRIQSRTLEWTKPLLTLRIAVILAYHANDPNVGMAYAKDLRRFKLFLADTGLLVTLIFKDKDFTENVIYEKLLSDKFSVNLGYVYENVAAQILTANGNALYYYTFLNEKSKHKLGEDDI